MSFIITLVYAHDNNSYKTSNNIGNIKRIVYEASNNKNVVEWTFEIKQDKASAKFQKLFRTFLKTHIGNRAVYSLSISHEVYFKEPYYIGEDFKKKLTGELCGKINCEFSYQIRKKIRALKYQLG